MELWVDIYHRRPTDLWVLNSHAHTHTHTGTHTNTHRHNTIQLVIQIVCQLVIQSVSESVCPSKPGDEYNKPKENEEPIRQWGVSGHYLLLILFVRKIVNGPERWLLFYGFPELWVCIYVFYGIMGLNLWFSGIVGLNFIQLPRNYAPLMTTRLAHPRLFKGSVPSPRSQLMSGWNAMVD